MECAMHGTPELPTPHAGERPEKSRSVLRFIPGLKYMCKYAKILKINLYFEYSGAILDI